jgi:flagellar protein FlaG
MVAISTVTQPRSVALPTSGSSHAGPKAANVQKPQPTAQPTAQLTAQPKQQESAATEQAVQKAVNEVNLDLAGSNETVALNYEKRLGLLYVQVTDNQSGEVIREIPSKDFIAHHIAMREMIGLFLDKKG